MNIENKQRKRIAALVRLLASDQQGEVLSALAALKRLCNLNDLGNMIEGASLDGKGNIRQDEMERLYNAGFEDGYDHGVKKGKEQGKASAHRNDFEDVYDSSTDAQRVAFCHKNKNKLKSAKERDFVESVMNWTTVRQKPLTPGQAKWLNDIFGRLGGKVTP